MGSITRYIYSRCSSFRFRRATNQNGHIRVRVPDIDGGPQDTSTSPTLGQTTKRRALLVGISYAHSQSDDRWPLKTPHNDVDMFRDLLVRVYGYSPEDITVLKDDPNFPDLLQPTRANMIRELKSLVANAASGDKFTFFYSGHSDQQLSFDDISVEEDSQDEVIITSDIQRIVDNELNDILVKPLPVDTFLLTVLDTCHSGNMLDFPHHHCNSVYVPWQSKPRHPAIGLSSLFGADYSLPSIADVMARDTDPLPSPYPRLRIDTQVGESTEPKRCRWSMGDSEARPAREGHLQRRYAAHPASPPLRPGSLLSPKRYDSPMPYVNCDGWCGYDPFARRIALSLSACSHPQCASDSPRVSLMTVLCKYLETHPRPSYRDLMSHVNFALHGSHTFPGIQKKEGSGFDGELDNFQEPKLSSLSKLNLDEIFQL